MNAKTFQRNFNHRNKLTKCKTFVFVNKVLSGMDSIVSYHANNEGASRNNARVNCTKVSTK